MLSLRAFVGERLTAAAEEIFEAVEKTIALYKEEIFRSKDLEISRLKMELRLLKSESGSDRCLEAQLLKHTEQHHPPCPPSPPTEPQHHQSSPAGSVSEPQSYEEPGDSSSSVDQEQPEPSRVKKEQGDIPRHFWADHDAEDLEDLEPDIKDFISSPSDLKASLHDQTLNFHPFLDSSIGEESKYNKLYCCSVCEKRFSNCSHLAAHIRTHTGERPYKCDICNKTFITTSALNRHQTIHTEGKRFVCTNCGKSFKWMESLGRHMRSVHKNDNMPE